MRLLAGEVRHFLAYLDRADRGSLGAVTVDDVRGFMVEMAPMRPAGVGNVVWSLKRFFAFLNAAGLSDVRVDGLLAHAAPRRVRALPCFTHEETGRLLEGIETGTPCGKRDHAMVMLAVSTGLRCCDIVALRLDEIDWHRDEIRLVQAKTSRPLVLPLPTPAGNDVAGSVRSCAAFSARLAVLLEGGTKMLGARNARPGSRPRPSTSGSGSAGLPFNTRPANSLRLPRCWCLMPSVWATSWRPGVIVRDANPAGWRREPQAMGQLAQPRHPNGRDVPAGR